MGKFVKSLSIITLALVLTTLCVSAVHAEESSEKAKQIMEKVFNKYVDLIKKDGEGIKTVAAKLSLKGGGNLPMGDSSMPLEIDVVLEIYVERPRNFSISLSGNLGNAAIVVSGAKKEVTVLFPNTKQFVTLDVPEEAFDTEPEAEGEPEKEPRIEDLWEVATVTYEGTEQTKAGKAHKIVLKPKDASETSVVTIHILDGKWDPARFELKDSEKGNMIVEIENLEVNKKISSDKFVPDTEGYTGATQDQLFMIVMMQVMGAMQQGGAE